VTSIALIAIGIAMFVRTIAAGAGGLSYGLILGVLFVAAGAGRLWVGRTG